MIMTERFAVIIAGSRDFQDYELLCRVCDHLFKNTKPTEILCGLARGADKLGERYALEHGIPVKYYPAYWSLHGKSAGFIRNETMAQNADALIAFWDGGSKGTKHMIALAEKYKLDVRVIRTVNKE